MGAAPVDLSHLPLHLLGSELFVCGLALHATFQLALGVGVDKDAEGIAVLQDIDSAAAYDDAVGLIRQLVQQLGLFGIDGDTLLDQRIGDRGEAAPDMDGEGDGGAAFGDLPHILLRQRRALGDLGDDLLVIVGVAQFFRQAAAQFTAAAAKFTANGNDAMHNIYSFRAPAQSISAVRRGASGGFLRV